MLKPCSLVCLLITILILTGCGGGGSSTITPPVQPPTQGSFWLKTNPPNLVLQAQTKATVQVTVMPENGFTGTVTITASGLPVGITADTIAVTVSTAGQSAMGTMTLTAAPIAQGLYSATLAGSSGTLSTMTPLSLNVAPFDSFTLPAITEIAVRVGSPGRATLFVSGSSNYLVNFDASNLPAGVTASFTPSVAAPGQSVVLTVSADATAKMAQNISFKVTATRPTDSYQAWRSVLLCVAPPLGLMISGPE